MTSVTPFQRLEDLLCYVVNSADSNHHRAWSLLYRTFTYWHQSLVEDAATGINVSRDIAPYFHSMCWVLVDTCRLLRVDHTLDALGDLLAWLHVHRYSKTQASEVLPNPSIETCLQNIENLLSSAIMAAGGISSWMKTQRTVGCNHDPTC
jgi:hypothetical protein